MVILQGFEALTEISQALNNEWLQESALNRACQAAVELFEVQHSGMVVFEEDTGVGVVKAEYPDSFGALNATIDTQHIPAEQDLLHKHLDIYFPDLSSTD